MVSQAGDPWDASGRGPGSKPGPVYPDIRPIPLGPAGGAWPANRIKTLWRGVSAALTVGMDSGEIAATFRYLDRNYEQYEVSPGDDSKGRR